MKIEKSKTLKTIWRASILLVILIVQVVVLQTDTFSPETHVAIYLVEVLKVFIYINLAWLLLLGIRYLIKNTKK